MAAAYIYRTNTSTASSWTFSAWVKRAGLGNNYLLSWGSSIGIGFGSTDYLQYYDSGSGSNPVTTAKYKDPNAWYHIVVKNDAGTLTFYVNGETPAGSGGTTGHALSSSTMSVGSFTSGSNSLDGCMSHVHFVDGTAYSASTFGETDATSGIWKIKVNPTVTYGSQGFFLKMEDRTNLDLDSSPNALTFTTSGDLTAAYDSPSNNFCTMSPLDNSVTAQTNGTQNFTNGNTTVECTTTSGNGLTNGTMGMSSGKWYWEMNLQAIGGAYPTIGIGAGSSYNFFVANSGVAEQTYGYGYLSAGSTNSKGNNGSYSTFGDSFTSGDVLSFALDMDNYKFYAAKNGVWQDSGDPTSGATGTGAMFTVNADQTYLPCNSGNSSVKFEYNFGNGYFGTTAVTSANADDAGIGAMEYDVPTGYYCLCTKNIKVYG